MKFHAHLTVNKNTVIPKGWKETTILLENDTNSQLDIMLTKHYKIGYKDINSVDDIKTDILSLKLGNLIRVKIEQDDDFYIPVSKANYVEIHALVPSETAIVQGWVKSKNPKKQIGENKFHFLNKRVFSGRSVHCIEQNAIRELANISVLEMKIEQVIYDSNFKHDEWWTANK